MLSGRLQGFIPQKLAHFEEHIVTLHTARAGPLRLHVQYLGMTPYTSGAR
jgi:hypothetical protein